MTERFLKLPEGWRRSRVSRVASVNARIGWKALAASEYIPEGHAFLSTPNIKSRTIDFVNVNHISDQRYNESPELKLQNGDVLLAKDGNTLGITNLVQDLPRSTTVNSSIAVLRPFGIHPGFLRYVLECDVTQQEISALKGGMGVPHLFQWDINRLSVPLPPPCEQGRIVTYLDAETGRIDQLVRSRRKMTLTLELKRRAVTLDLIGLNGKTTRDPMAPLKYLVDHVSVGIVITPARWYVSTGGVPALRGLNVRPGQVAMNDLVQISVEGHSLHQKSALEGGDIVVVRTGQAGHAAVVPQELHGANCIDLIRVKPGVGLIPKYLEYVLNSDYARAQVAENSVGSIQGHFNVGAMKQMPIPRIALKTQKSIVDEITETVGHIDSLAAKLLEQVSVVRERRQALITAAVTGQFDVSAASGRGVTE